MIFNDHVRSILFDIFLNNPVLSWQDIKDKTNSAGELAIGIVQQINQDLSWSSDLLQSLDSEMQYVSTSAELYALSGDELKVFAIKVRDSFEDSCINYINKLSEVHTEIESLLNQFSVGLLASAEADRKTIDCEDRHYL